MKYAMKSPSKKVGGCWAAKMPTVLIAVLLAAGLLLAPGSTRTEVML